jgi:GDP-D-mannose 3',5'-epimerase
MSQRSALVCGAGGFIGNHLVRRLKRENYFVAAVDLKFPEFSKSPADIFLIGDLRDHSFCERLFRRFDLNEVYQLAADMGGAGYLFTGEHDADILRHSTQINLNVLDCLVKSQIKNIFFSSSACIYPVRNQMNPESPNTSELSAYPAEPDSDYGWEKLYGERLYLAHARNYGLNVKIARFHNVFGPEGAYKDGREKVIAALCRKVAEAKSGEAFDVWGDGNQTRSFLYIDECLEGVSRLMRSEVGEPMNLGSSEKIAIADLARMIVEISGKELRINFVDGPVGVRGRSSDNRLIQERLGWSPSMSLRLGVEQTYEWISKQVHQTKHLSERHRDNSPLVGEMFYDFFR